MLDAHDSQRQRSDSYESPDQVEESSSGVLLSLASLFVAAILVPGFMCTCGHLDRFGFMATGAAAALAWYPFIVDRPKSFVARSLIMAMVVFATLLLLKNLGDVLWFGHNPLLP